MALAGRGARQVSEQYLVMSQLRACCGVQWMGRRPGLAELVFVWGDAVGFWFAVGHEIFKFFAACRSIVESRLPNQRPGRLMKEQQSKSWKQRVISALICLLVCWVIYVEAMSLIAWHFAREMSQMSPNLGVVPTPLVDTSVAKLDGPRIEKFGFCFRSHGKRLHGTRPGRALLGSPSKKEAQ